MCNYIRSISAAVATVSILASVAVSSLPAYAQTQSESGANSSSSSSANVRSSAQASSSSGSSNAQIYLDQRGRAVSKTTHQYSGSYEVRSAPAVQPPSMGSGHPCGLSGSIGISIIGGGVGAGISQVDEACLLAQMGQGQAALMMIATRDPAACVALRKVGSIPGSSICSQDERREAERAERELNAIAAAPAFVAPVAAPEPTDFGLISDYVSCSRNDIGQLVARKTRTGPFSDDQIAQYCRDQNIQMASMSFVDPGSAASLADYVTCSRNEMGQLVARKARDTPFSDAEVAQYCRDQQ